MPEIRVLIQRKQVVALVLVILCGLLLLVSDLAAPAAFEDNRYLTPIPENTRRAFNLHRPISNKLEAAIAGQLLASTGHFNFLTTPIVRTVEELSLAQAREKLSLTSADSRPPDTKVWLVIMQGDIQIVPPPFDNQGQRTTPWVIYGSCGFVLAEAQTPTDYLIIGGIECPAK